MEALVRDYKQGVFNATEGPCISLYQRTHRTHPDNQQDPIRFRNQLDDIEKSLRRDYPGNDVTEMMKPFRKLVDDTAFWNHALDGLAVLANGDKFKVYRLQRPVPDIAIVADSFHTKPLLRMIQSADQFQILALDRHELTLYQGNRDAIDEVPLSEDVPTTIEEALGEELTEEHLTVATYGGSARGRAMIHGHGSKKEELDIDTERFFRAIDKAILEHHSNPSGLPLLLAALPEYHGLFRKLSNNHHLMDTALDKHPDSLDKEELRKRAWQAVEPQYLKRLQGLVDKYENGKAHGRGSDDIGEIARAAVAGQVATLLLDADKQKAGVIDPETGNIDFEDLDNPHIDDVFDDLGELVLKMGGEVIIVPAERMPTDSGAAAVYRFSSEPNE
jgi:hypothetical protein